MVVVMTPWVSLKEWNSVGSLSIERFDVSLGFEEDILLWIEESFGCLVFDLGRMDNLTGVCSSQLHSLPPLPQTTDNSPIKARH
jgi:hypothetical protein